MASLTELSKIMIRDYPECQDRCPVALDQLLSTNNRLLNISVRSRAIFTEWARLIKSAKYSICIGVYVWEDDCDASRLLSQAFKELESLITSPISVRIIVNNKHLFNFSLAPVKQFLLKTNLNPDLFKVEIANFRGSLCRHYHHKVLIIDEEVANIGGANIQKKISFDTDTNKYWLDTAFTFEGDSARICQEDFDYYWREVKGNITSYPLPSPKSSIIRRISSGYLPIIVLPQTDVGCFPDTKWSPLLVAIKYLLETATTIVKIRNPVANSLFYAELIAGAIKRGVRVKLMLSINWSDTIYDLLYGGSNYSFIYRQLLPLLTKDDRQLFEFKWYSNDGIKPTPRKDPASSHAKYLGVDGKFSLVGSTNYNVISTRSTEIGFLIEDVKTTLEIEGQTFDEDWDLGVRD